MAARRPRIYPLQALLNPKADALWKAKCDLRAEGHPVRDWAAWVLSGDPD